MTTLTPCRHCGDPCEHRFCSQACADADQVDPVIAREERREAFLRWVDEPDQPAEG